MTPVEEPVAGPKRARRADWERNRNAILEAAAAMLCVPGQSFDVRDIAERSGVGMGTLYRHFPTKDDLQATVLEHLLSTWAEAAREAAAQIEDPRAALEDFFEQTLTGQGRGPALARCYAGKPHDPVAAPARLLHPILDDLRDRAQRAGLIRVDVTTEDLLLLLALLSRSTENAGPGQPDPWLRLLRISLDGLSSQHTEPLPT